MNQLIVHFYVTGTPGTEVKDSKSVIKAQLSMSQLAHVQDSLQVGLTALGQYRSSITAVQIEQDLNAISHALHVLQPTVLALPTSNVSLDEVLLAIPRGILKAVSLQRATSCFGNISPPLTPADGDIILAGLKDIQVQLIAVLTIYNDRIVAVEKTFPGLNPWGITTIQGLYDGLIEAFIAVAPPNIPREDIKAIHTTIDEALKHTLSIITS